MTPDERRRFIADVTAARGRIRVQDLLQMVDASPETLRRDLTALARTGQIRKVHGGAVSPDFEAEGKFAARLRRQAAAKQAIAAAAAGLFAPGDSVMMDTGTTTLALAKQLGRRDDLLVITNSAQLAAAAATGGNRVQLLGGAYRREGQELVGGTTVQQIEGFHPDHVILTVAGLDVAGIGDLDEQEATVARAMLGTGGKLTVVADSTKFYRRYLYRICGLSRIANAVVDIAPPTELKTQLRESRVAVHFPTTFIAE
jgi:DeoR family glycerol-3-phosphate regulon repressor